MHPGTDQKYDVSADPFDPDYCTFHYDIKVRTESIRSTDDVSPSCEFRNRVNDVTNILHRSVFFVPPRVNEILRSTFSKKGKKECKKLSVREKGIVEKKWKRNVSISRSH